TPAALRPLMAAVATAAHFATLRPSVREAGTASWIAFGRVLAWRWTERAKEFHFLSAFAMELTKRPVLATSAMLNVLTVAIPLRHLPNANKPPEGGLAIPNRIRYSSLSSLPWPRMDTRASPFGPRSVSMLSTKPTPAYRRPSSPTMSNDT